MACVIDIKVIPSSGRQEWALDKNGTLKCYLKSPAEQGKANDELMRMIARAVHTTLKDVSIVSGQTSRKKRVHINKNVTPQGFIELLGLELQQRIC